MYVESNKVTTYKVVGKAKYPQGIMLDLRGSNYREKTPSLGLVSLDLYLQSWGSVTAPSPGMGGLS